MARRQETGVAVWRPGGAMHTPCRAKMPGILLNRGLKAPPPQNRWKFQRLIPHSVHSSFFSTTGSVFPGFLEVFWKEGSLERMRKVPLEKLFIVAFELLGFGAFHKVVFGACCQGMLGLNSFSPTFFGVFRIKPLKALKRWLWVNSMVPFWGRCTTTF